MPKASARRIPTLKRERQSTRTDLTEPLLPPLQSKGKQRAEPRLEVSEIGSVPTTPGGSPSGSKSNDSVWRHTLSQSASMVFRMPGSRSRGGSDPKQPASPDSRAGIPVTPPSPAHDRKVNRVTLDRIYRYFKKGPEHYTRPATPANFPGPFTTPSTPSGEHTLTLGHRQPSIEAPWSNSTEKHSISSGYLTATRRVSSWNQGDTEEPFSDAASSLAGEPAADPFFIGAGGVEGPSETTPQPRRVSASVSKTTSLASITEDADTPPALLHFNPLIEHVKATATSIIPTVPLPASLEVSAQGNPRPTQASPLAKQAYASHVLLDPTRNYASTDDQSEYGFEANAPTSSYYDDRDDSDDDAPPIEIRRRPSQAQRRPSAGASP